MALKFSFLSRCVLIKVFSFFGWSRSDRLQKQSGLGRYLTYMSEPE